MARAGSGFHGAGVRVRMVVAATCLPDPRRLPVACCHTDRSGRPTQGAGDEVMIVRHRRDGDRAPRPLLPGRWLALSASVSVASIALLSLRWLGLGLLATRGSLAVFLLGELLGVGGVVFAVRSRRAASGGSADAAAQHLLLARRWALAGGAFVLGMFLIAAATHLVRPVMTD